MATEQYINQNLKTPVFPIEWLIFKNYRNSDIAHFTNQKNKNQVIYKINLFYYCLKYSKIDYFLIQ